MSLQIQIAQILSNVLQPGNKAALQMSENTPLLGSIPEFDSMAVVSVITALEEHFGIAIDDDEIDASVFETLGCLVKFVSDKLQID